jgi:hypothetical protein
MRTDDDSSRRNPFLIGRKSISCQARTSTTLLRYLGGTFRVLEGKRTMAWDSNLDALLPAYQIAADNSRCIRVLAGPGTGKSFALKRRVARILEGGIAPTRILPVTFTKGGGRRFAARAH